MRKLSDEIKILINQNAYITKNGEGVNHLSLGGIHDVVLLMEQQLSNTCSVCGGHPISKKPCICSGNGTAVDEMLGLRGLVYDLEQQVIDLQAKVAAKSYGSPARPVTVDGIRYPSMNQAEIRSGKGMRYIRNHGVFE